MIKIFTLLNKCKRERAYGPPGGSLPTRTQLLRGLAELTKLKKHKQYYKIKHLHKLEQFKLQSYKTTFGK